MRGYHDYDFFPFPPHYGPWDHGFGPWGRKRPPFNPFGSFDCDRRGGRPHGPSGFNKRPDFSPHDWNHHHWGQPLPESHDERPYRVNDHHHHRPSVFGNRPENHCRPGCGPRGRCEDFNGPGFANHKNPEDFSRYPDCHDARQCNKHAPAGSHQGPSHHVGHGQVGRDHGDSHCFRPQFETRFQDNRPHPNRRRGRLEGECKDCQNRPCCSGNRDERITNRNRCDRNENEQSDEGNKDNTTENTVLVQKIIVATAPTRPQSV